MFEEDDEEMLNPHYVSFEDRKKKFLEKVITDIEKINYSLDEIPFVLSDETQALIARINTTKSELDQLISDKEFNTRDEKEILSELHEHLKKLPPQLKQLPYSNQLFIDKLCKAINTLLEKLANFFMNGLIVGEGVCIANPSPSQPNHFNFFHPSTRTNTSVDDLSNQLSSYSRSS